MDSPLKRVLEAVKKVRPHIPGIVFRVLLLLLLGNGGEVAEGVGVEGALGRVGALVSAWLARS